MLAILRACPTSLSLLWRIGFVWAVAPVLLVDSALDMQSINVNTESIAENTSVC